MNTEEEEATPKTPMMPTIGAMAGLGCGVILIAGAAMIGLAAIVYSVGKMIVALWH